MGLIRLANATGKLMDDADDYSTLATLACVLGGAVFIYVVLGGDYPREQHTQSERDADEDDARTALLRACTRVLSWEADSDDDVKAPQAFAKALDGALTRARSVHDGLSTMATPPSVNAWAQKELQSLVERDMTGTSAGLELGSTALALTTSRKDHWEAHDTIGDSQAAAFVVAASESVHASVLLLGAACRPSMPCAGERGLLVVAAGALADEAGARHRPGACLAFRQSETRVLRAAQGPVLCVLLRVPDAGAERADGRPEWGRPDSYALLPDVS